MLCFVLVLYFTVVPIPDKKNTKEKETTQNQQRSATADDGEEVQIIDYRRDSETLELENGALRQSERQPERSVFQELRLLLSSPKICMYLFTVFIMGMGSALIGSFLFLFLEDLGGA